MTKKSKAITIDNGKVPIKAWVKGVDFDPGAKEQLLNLARMPFIYKWVAAMPDVHKGIGATVGSVIPTYKAVIPSAVGVDIGCGMMAVRTNLNSNQLPDNLYNLRFAIEKSVPHGMGSRSGGRGKGSWSKIPPLVEKNWKRLKYGFKIICDKHPILTKTNNINQLGTLGSGNHFIEVCIDEENQVWIMLHSGSRGVGNKIGTYFIEKAKKDMERQSIRLPDKDLAYFQEGSQHFAEYFQAVSWAQDFARINRNVMMENIITAMKKELSIKNFKADLEAVNCHHNYVSQENHFGKDVYVTRKGAVRAGEGERGIIPGSMGDRSYIVEGRGNPESFCSCSHGAGRVMSRSQAKKRYTLKDHIRATEEVECRKDIGVIDETPMAYKNIDQVMRAQSDLIKIVYTLKQVVCVKG